MVLRNTRGEYFIITRLDFAGYKLKCLSPFGTAKGLRANRNTNLLTKWRVLEPYLVIMEIGELRWCGTFFSVSAVSAAFRPGGRRNCFNISIYYTSLQPDGVLRNGGGTGSTFKAVKNILRLRFTVLCIPTTSNKRFISYQLVNNNALHATPKRLIIKCNKNTFPIKD